MKLLLIYYYHAHILNALRIIVTIVGVLFFRYGCGESEGPSNDKPIALIAPRYFSVVSISEKSLRLEWSGEQNYSDITYEIERADSNQIFIKIGTVKLSSSSFTDSSLSRSIEYSYRVRAIRDTLYSPYSEIIKVKYDQSIQLLRTLNTDNYVRYVLISSDGSYLVSSVGNSTINIWRTSDWSLTIPDNAGYLLYEPITLTPDSKYVIAGGHYSIKIFSLSNGLLVRSIANDSVYTESLAITSDGTKLVSSDSKHRIQLWQYDNGKLLGNLDSSKYDDYELTINPRNNFLIAATSQYLKQWDLNQRLVLKQINGIFSHPVYNSDGSVLSVNIAYVSTNLKESDFSVICSFGLNAASTTFSPDGATQLIGDDNIIRIIRTSDGKIIGSLSGHTNSVLALAFFPDGKTFVSGSLDHTLKIWSFSLVEQWHII